MKELKALLELGIEHVNLRVSRGGYRLSVYWHDPQDKGTGGNLRFNGKKLDELIDRVEIAYRAASPKTYNPDVPTT